MTSSSAPTASTPPCAGSSTPTLPNPSYTGLISFGARVATSPGLPSTEGKMPMSFGKQAFFGYQVFD